MCFFAVAAGILYQWCWHSEIVQVQTTLPDWFLLIIWMAFPVVKTSTDDDHFYHGEKGYLYFILPLCMSMNWLGYFCLNAPPIYLLFSIVWKGFYWILFEKKIYFPFLLYNCIWYHLIGKTNSYPVKAWVTIKTWLCLYQMIVYCRKKAPFIPRRMKISLNHRKYISWHMLIDAFYSKRGDNIYMALWFHLIVKRAFTVESENPKRYICLPFLPLPLVVW